MKNFFSLLRRLMNTLQCFGKRRYGYLDRSSCYIPQGDGEIFLILSPDLYHISVVSLPVATANEALRYAQAYFDMSDERTIYAAFRLEKGRFLFTACDPETIRIRLEEAQVDPSTVQHFVLSQEAFGSDILPISLNDASALAMSDGVVVQLPINYLSTPVRHGVQDALKNLLPCLSGFTADMHKAGAATRGTLTITAILSALIVFNLFLQGVFSYSEANQMISEQERIKESRNLPATQMELDALAASWEKKEADQIKLRNIMAAFGALSLESNSTVASAPSIPAAAQNGIVLVPGSNPSERNLLLIPGSTNKPEMLSSGESITSLVYEKGLITFKILTPSPDRAEKLRDTVSKTLKTNSVTVKENSVEGSVQ